MTRRGLSQSFNINLRIDKRGLWAVFGPPFLPKNGKVGGREEATLVYYYPTTLGIYTILYMPPPYHTLGIPHLPAPGTAARVHPSAQTSGAGRVPGLTSEINNEEKEVWEPLCSKSVIPVMLLLRRLLRLSRA